MGVYFYGIFEIDERMAEGSNLNEKESSNSSVVSISILVISRYRYLQ